MKNMAVLLIIIVLSSCCTGEKKNDHISEKWKYDEHEMIAGYIDKEGKWIIEPDEKYFKYGKFENGNAHYSFEYYNLNMNIKRFLDKNGTEKEEEIKKGRFEEVRNRFKEKGLWFSVGFYEGIENEEFFIVGKPVEPDENGKVDYKNGIMDKNFNLLTEMNYKFRGRFNLGLAPAQIKKGDIFRYGYLNIKGETVIDPEFDYAEPFWDNGLAKVCRRDKGNYIDGLIDTKGNRILPLEYSYISEFSEGLAVACKNGADNKFSCFYFNEKGEKASPLTFVYAKPFKNGVAVVKEKNRKAGFINKEFQYIINPQFDDASDFSEGLAAVKIGENCNKREYDCGKWGFIDINGNWVIKPKFNGIGTGFSEGLAKVYIWVKSEMQPLPNEYKEQILIWKDDSGKEKKIVILLDEMDNKKNKKVFVNGKLTEEYDAVPEMDNGKGAWKIENKVKKK